MSRPAFQYQPGPSSRPIAMDRAGNACKCVVFTIRPYQRRAGMLFSPRRTAFAAAVLIASHAAVAGVTREHPYLYFTSEIVSRIQLRLDKEPFKTRWERFLSIADGHLGRGTYGFGNPRNALGVAGNTAFAYAITGEQKYADRAKEEAFALMDASAWHEVKSWNKGAELGTAEASVACALVYDWCYDALSAQERARFKSEILSKSTNIYLSSIETHNDWWVTNPVTNWCGVCHGGCGLAALALYDEDPAFEKAAGYAFDHLEAFLDSVVLADGAGHEGIMYHRYGVTFGNYFYAAATHVFGDDRGLAARTADKLAGYWHIYMQAPDSLYANFNNMNESTFAGLYGADHRKWEGGPPAVLCALWEAQAGGDDLLLWGADNGGAAFYWEGICPMYFVWRRDDDPAGQKPSLPKATLFRGAGHVIFNEPDLWFAYNGGWTSNKSHHNNDLGTFVLVANGERLVNDPGYGKATTADHSSILVNGNGQPENVAGEFLHFGSGDGFHYLASDLSSCYEDNLTRFVRHAVMVDGSYIVLLDDLAAPSASQFQWRLQTEGAVRASGANATVQGQDNVLHVVAAAPQDAQATTGTETIDFVRIQPATQRAEETIVAVLYPAESGGTSPAVTWSAQGTLSVGNDAIVFSGGAGQWKLQSVKGEAADDIDRVNERTVKSQRSTNSTRHVRRHQGVGPVARIVRVDRRGVVVEMLRAGIHSARVIGLNGRVMATQNADARQQRLEFSLPEGMYILTIATGTWSHRQKLVVYP
ncbi:MAG: DUF4962 domain-containing protein [Chitinivibrionales bacterium]|nr:DUF4962 domain-containing protein [Chitinivibrionales bacterium]